MEKQQRVGVIHMKAARGFDFGSAKARGKQTGEILLNFAAQQLKAMPRTPENAAQIENLRRIQDQAERIIELSRP